MTFRRFSIAIVASCVFSSSAFAGEMADQCVERGGNDAMCSCIEEQIESDPGLEEDLAALEGSGGGDPAERMAALSDDARAALGQCFGG